MSQFAYVDGARNGKRDQKRVLVPRRRGRPMRPAPDDGETAPELTHEPITTVIATKATMSPPGGGRARTKITCWLAHVGDGAIECAFAEHARPVKGQIEE